MKKVAIFLPSRSQDVINDLDTVGTGAREQIAYWLANHLAPKNEVHVFTNMEESVHKPNQHWVAQEMAAPMLQTYEWDALVSFDFPSVATLPDIKKTVKRVVVAQNYFEIPPEGFTPDVFDLIDSWVFPSSYALENCSRVNDTPVHSGVVIPYAVDEDLYRDNRREHDSFRFIYANQAENGLAQTLRMWPDIQAEYPDALLTVATDCDEFVEQIQWSHSIQSELALDIRDLITQDGVRYIGRQGTKNLAKEFYASDFLLYPAEPLSPSEIGSLPILQAASSGCHPIFTPVDALPELYNNMGSTSSIETFVDKVKFLARHAAVHRQDSWMVARRDRDAEKILDLWKRELNVD